MKYLEPVIAPKATPIKPMKRKGTKSFGTRPRKYAIVDRKNTEICKNYLLV
jgi:hypothetical protein